MRILTCWLWGLGLLAMSGCAASSPKVSLPEAVSDMARREFGKDTTQTVWGELPETWPPLRLKLSWDSKLNGVNARYRLQETLRSLVYEQLTANRIGLNDGAAAELQVHIVQAGVPKTGSTTGTMKLVKVRLAAWLVLPGQPLGAFQGTFDGIHVLSDAAKPGRTAYQVAVNDAVSRLVRQLRVAKQKVEAAS